MTTPADTARVLALIQTFDNRKVDELTIASWHSIVGHLNFDDACTAVRQHYTRSSAWIMPSDLISAVKALRTDRLDRTPDAIPDADPDDPTAYIDAIRGARHRTADGREPRDMRAITSTFPSPPPTDWRPELPAARTSPRLTGLPPVDAERMAQARAELDALRPAPADNTEPAGNPT